MASDSRERRPNFIVLRWVGLGPAFPCRSAGLLTWFIPLLAPVCPDVSEKRKREERKKGKGIPLGSRAPFSLSTLAKGRTFLKWMRDPVGSQPSKPGWAPRQAAYSSSGPRLDQALWGRRKRRRERKRVERSQLNILPTPLLYPQEIKCS